MSWVTYLIHVASTVPLYCIKRVERQPKHAAYSLKVLSAGLPYCAADVPQTEQVADSKWKEWGVEVIR
jgi:hypothetical protein